MIETPTCPYCDEIETPYHALFLCRRVRELWNLCDCAAICEKMASDVRDSLIEWENFSTTMQQRGAFLAWVIWGERNGKVFKNNSTPNDILVARVARFVEENNKYSRMIYARRNTRSQSPSHWIAPNPGTLKLNVDAHIDDEGWVGLGVIVRDHLGQVRAATVRHHRAWWTPEVAEGKAMLLAIKLAHQLKLTDVILESDCQALVTRLSSASTYCTEFDHVLEDILAYCCNFNSLLWSHVKRDGNYAAHHLARLVPFGFQQTWENSLPMEIHPYVLSDALSI